MKQLRVVLALITQENDYQREQAAAAESTAKRLGMNLRVVYAENDAILQTKQILAAIHADAAERPDAIVVEPVGTGMLGIAGTAAGKGIGWVVLNREADYLAPLRASSTVPLGSIESDNVEVGRIQGRQFAELLPQGGTVLYIEGPGTDAAKQRRAGVDQTLPGNIELKSFRGRWTEESAFQLVEAWLHRRGQQPPNVGVIGCQNDAMAMGARKAVEVLAASAQREQWLRVPFTGVDGVPATGQAWVRQGLLAATVVTPALAGTALEILSRAITSGTPLPERTVKQPTSYPAVDQLRPKATAA